jgi:hypothetical protein
MHHSSQVGIVPLIIWCIVLSPVILYVHYCIEIARRRRGDVKFRAKRIAIALVLYLGGIVLMRNLGYSIFHSIFVGFLMGVAGGFKFARPPVRNRRIPKGIRQAVIARDLKGTPFNPAIHHIDHIVPYSKGGDHSLENLRVMLKHDNLRRGAQMPKLRDFHTKR